MSPPGEIKVINPQSRAIFAAHPTGLYNTKKSAFQYRVAIPGIETSLVTLDVTTKELRQYLLNNKPIPVSPAR